MSPQARSAPREWLARLADSDVLTMLEGVARLPEAERRGVLADPYPYLERAGLRPPRGISVRLSDDPPGPEEPVPPGLPELPIPTPRLICARLCTPLIVKPADRIFVTRCVSYCFWYDW